MYFMIFFLFISCPFTSHLHAPLTQYHMNPSILKKRLFDTDSHPFSFPFKFDPTLTRHHLQSSIVCNTVFFSRPPNSFENKSMTIHSIPAYQGCSFFFPFLLRRKSVPLILVLVPNIPSFDDPEMKGF